jgi:hypothetical protein
MMNAIETQLSQAMSGLPPSSWEIDNRPGSPSSVGRSPRTHSAVLGRSVLGDAQSSILTLETGPAMSVLGAAGARAQKRNSSSTFVRSSEARGDKSMAERVASIQQKVCVYCVEADSEAGDGTCQCHFPLSGVLRRRCHRKLIAGTSSSCEY